MASSSGCLGTLETGGSQGSQKTEEPARYLGRQGPGVLEHSLDVSGIDPDTVTGTLGSGVMARMGQGETQSAHLNLTVQILSTAYSQMGKPYLKGEASPEKGFDNPGFVFWVFEQNGINIPRSGQDQFKTAGDPVSKEEVRPGDLLFFRRSEQKTVHVGIYAGHGLFIHSPNPGDRVQESEAFAKFWGEHFVQARRVHDDPEAAPLSAAVKQNIINKALVAKSLPVEDAKPSRVKKTYVVKKGDTASIIAHRFNVSTDELLRLNRLTKRSTLHVGQKLLIPGGGEASETASLGEASTPPPKPKPKAVSESREYVVQKGDVASSIAERFDVSTRELLEANGLTPQSTLHIGQKLVVPGLGGETPVKTVAASAPAPQPRPKAVAGSQEYIVQQGDVASSIAGRFSVSTLDLLEVNGLTPQSTLHIGQKLVIPKGGKEKTPEKPAPQKTATQESATPDKPKKYTVQKGDVASSIARRFGVSTTALLKANGLSPQSTLHIGQVLTLP